MINENTKQMFLDMTQTINNKLLSTFEERLGASPTKHSFAAAIKQMYIELNDISGPTAYRNDPLYIEFMNSLQIDEINEHSSYMRKGLLNIIKKSTLKLKIDDNMFLLIICGLFSLISTKLEVGNYHFDIFNFLVDNAIEGMFY